jgi:Flp pilus assembly secretin CpaC
VPILGDLPLVGPAFSRTETSKSKTELLIFLTPHVAVQPEALKPISQEEMRGTTLTPNAVGPGVFQQHIEGLRRGQTEITTQPATRAVGPAARIFTETPTPITAPPPPPDGGPATRPATAPAGRPMD